MAGRGATGVGWGAWWAASRGQLDTVGTMGWFGAVVGGLRAVEDGFVEPRKREVERWRETPQ